jgi:serine/threonine protein kinase
VLTNFGLAQIASSALSVNSTIGRIPRDPRFAAPELLDSRIGAGVTEKTDVYSFGMTMFQVTLLTYDFTHYVIV